MDEVTEIQEPIAEEPQTPDVEPEVAVPETELSETEPAAEEPAKGLDPVEQSFKDKYYAEVDKRLAAETPQTAPLTETQEREAIWKYIKVDEVLSAAAQEAYELYGDGAPLDDPAKLRTKLLSVEKAAKKDAQLQWRIEQSERRTAYSEISSKTESSLLNLGVKKDTPQYDLTIKLCKDDGLDVNDPDQMRQPLALALLKAKAQIAKGTPIFDRTKKAGSAPFKPPQQMRDDGVPVRENMKRPSEQAQGNLSVLTQRLKRDAGF